MAMSHSQFLSFKSVTDKQKTPNFFAPSPGGARSASPTIWAWWPLAGADSFGGKRQVQPKFQMLINREKAHES